MPAQEAKEDADKWENQQDLWNMTDAKQRL